MLDISWLCSFAVRAVYWLVLLACNFLGYSPVWAKHAWKRRQQEECDRVLKTPSHLAVLFCERRVSKNELISLFDCCLSSGVRKVSVYDPWNDCISFEHELSIFCKAKNIAMVVGEGSNVKECSSSQLTVHLLAADAGRATLVRACRKMAGGSSPVSVTAVSSLLADSYGLTDPELLVQVGQTPSLAGYPPWNLRVTEFVQVSTLPCTRSSFEDCLVAFSKRDVRLGK